MAFNKTKYQRKRTLDHFFGQVSAAFPTQLWLGLFSGDPTEDGLLTDEITQTGYARIEIVPMLTPAILASGMITNALEINFPVAGADWDEISHAAIIDSATIGAGNVLYFGPAVSTRIIELGDTFKIRVGQLVIMER